MTIARRFNVPVRQVEQGADPGALERLAADIRRISGARHNAGRMLLREDSQSATSTTYLSIGNAEGVLKFNGTLASGDTQEFAHGLGREPVGWIVEDIIGAPALVLGVPAGLPILVRSQPFGDRTITLTGYGAFWCKVWVF